MQAHSCRHRVHLQCHGGLGRGQPLPGHESDQLTIGFWKASDCGDQHLVLVAVDNDIGGVCVLLTDGTQQQRTQPLSASLATPMIEKNVAGDTEQPRSEVIAARNLLAASLHDQEHLRGHIRSI